MIARFLPCMLLIALVASVELTQADPLLQTQILNNPHNSHRQALTSSSHELPTYSIYLNESPTDRYKQLINEKKILLNQFIDYLYKIPNFNYSMWVAKTVFYIFPDFLIRSYLGQEFYDQCHGIAIYSQRKLYQIVVFNYMYEIGAANDFCTSLALTQVVSQSMLQQDKNYQKQNLTLLARNLDYGFQQFLGKNTIRLDFYKDNNSTKPVFTTLTHAGFVSSHTVFKYESSSNLQFGLVLNQRHSGSFMLTLGRVLFNNCESVFQLTNRILNSDISTTDELVRIVTESNSCSTFYFTIQTKNGDNVLIQKNYGTGVHEVYLKNISGNLNSENPFFILQTNTDQDKPDPDGRRDQAVNKLENVIRQQGFIQQQDIQQILLESPNFNDLTIMTAIMDVGKGEIRAIVWQSSFDLTKQNLNK